MNKSSTKSQIISDVKKVQSGTAVRISRDFYRENGKHSERQWQKYFPTFAALMSAAGFDEEQPVAITETNEITKDSWSIDMPKTRICTLEQLIAHCKIDLSVWEVERFVANKWEMASAKSGVTPLFQIKANLKKKSLIVAIKEEILALKELAKTGIRTTQISLPARKTGGQMLELSLPDAHFGKLAWGQETGHENYDLKIAQQVYMGAFNALLGKVKDYSFDEVVLVVGNDLLNSDDLEGQTTKGTKVCTDGRYQKTFTIVRNLMIECIEKARKIAAVKVIMVSGNHDMLSVWHLGDSLECFYNNAKDVVIDNRPTYRKYHQFGKVMLLLTHGDKGKRNDLPLLMATEQPKMFGETTFREAHTGHLHQTRLDEQHGIRVRILPSLSPADSWHAEQGYIGNLRNAEAYVWDRLEGLTAIHIYNDQRATKVESK